MGSLKRLGRRLEEPANAVGAVAVGYKRRESWHLRSRRQRLGHTLAALGRRVPGTSAPYFASLFGGGGARAPPAVQ